MKVRRLVALILSLSVCIFLLTIAAYCANITPNIPLEKFMGEMRQMELKYNDYFQNADEYASRLIVKSKYNIPSLDALYIVEGYNDWHIVQFHDEQSAAAALDCYNKERKIEYAEPDAIVSVSDDGYSESLNEYGNHLSWGSESIGVDDYISYIDNTSALPEIVVGIIDTGVDLEHEFLKDRIIETGFNFSNTGVEDSEADDHGHGSRMAGVIVDNTLDNVKIKSFKCMNSSGDCKISQLIVTVDYAVKSDVNVINMSLSCDEKSTVLKEIIDNAVGKGITFCVSSGNNNDDASNYYPAAIDSCITVAAISASDSAPTFTNYGNAVDIVAPGVSINSCDLNNSYIVSKGTSLATPFVTSAAALILSKNYNASPKEICAMLTENARQWTMDENVKNYDVGALDLRNLIDYSEAERTTTPEFSNESGRYTDYIDLEISCADSDADIYYTLNGNKPTDANAMLYENPIRIDKNTTVKAVAYSEGKLKSFQTSADYYITHIDADSKFIISSNGTIINYLGSEKYLTIPDTIKGITVRAISTSVFSNSSIEIIKLPDSLTKIGSYAFSGCSSLIMVDANNIQNVGVSAFANCSLLKSIDFSQMESVDEGAFRNCISIEKIYNDKLTVVNSYAFAGMDNLLQIDLPNVTKVNFRGISKNQNLIYVNLPKLETLYYYGLADLESLEMLYLPKLKTLKSDSTGIGGEFSNCNSLKILFVPSLKSINAKSLSKCTSLKTLFAPNLVEAKSLPKNNNLTLYLSDDFTTGEFDDSDTSSSKLNIVAPENSNAQDWADKENYTFTDTNDIKFKGLEKTNLIYTSNNGEAKIPFSFVDDCWNADLINTSRYDTDYMFVFDFNNDKIINAKDYSILKNLKNKA